MAMMSLKEKLTGYSGGLASMASFLGSYQVCHTVCLWLVALLSLFGITVAGMPLFFLTKVTLPFWIVAVVLFVLSLLFYFVNRCVSPALLFITFGLLVAGVPFSWAQQYPVFLWIFGGIFVAVGVSLFLRSRWLRRKRHGS